MIDIKAFNDEIYFKQYKESLEKRGASVEILNTILELNKQRKLCIAEAESTKAHQNKVSQQIPILKKEGKDASELLKELGELSQKAKALEQKAADADLEVLKIVHTLPNKIQTEVPKGGGSEDNICVSSYGAMPNFTFRPREHFELGENLNIIDFERAGKTTGTRFTFLKGAAARLERALIQFMMDVHSNEHGYEEMIPPFIVNSNSLFGTGQFPKFKEDVFHLENTDYYLIPTAEVPVTNYFNNEILKDEDLPKSFCAYSPCFRSEAGSHGRDTKGLIRQHQFNKVELMTFCRPNESNEMHEKLTLHAETILKKLNLHFRRMLLCSGDIGFGSAKTYDLEVWLPGQNAFREISSCSNFEDFQARRANIRYRDPKTGKPAFVHTLNGSGLAVGRTLIAILENYQNEDGSITIPEVLVSYMGGLKTIR